MDSRLITTQALQAPQERARLMAKHLALGCEKTAAVASRFCWHAGSHQTQSGTGTRKYALRPQIRRLVATRGLAKLNWIKTPHPPRGSAGESVLYSRKARLSCATTTQQNPAQALAVSTSMKAIVRTQYGPPDVLRFTEVQKPSPKDNEVLIKLYAASVNPLDLFHMRGAPWNRRIPGPRTPNQPVIGCDIAGRVEAVGRDAKQFQPGEAVFGITGFAGGGFAEYVCAPEAKLAPKPANLSFEDTAAVPIAAITALQALRDKGKLQPGQKILLDGASGGVGTFAIQIAKSLGAEVTAVCSTRNVDTARSLGADHVLDYTQEDFRKSGERYDLILAANANHSIFDY